MKKLEENYIHPGEVLKRELRARGIQQKEMAARIGMKAPHFSELLCGKRPLSIETAQKISRELGLPTESLMNMQVNYQLAHKASNEDLEEQEAQKRLEEYDLIMDIKLISKRLDIRYEKPYRKVLQTIDGMLRLSEPKELERQCAGWFRKSEKTGLDERMILTWVTLAKYFAMQQTLTGTFNRNNVPELKRKLSGILHKNENVETLVSKTLSEYGIRFGIVEKVPRASIDGYSFIQDGIPAIVVTKRFDRIDNFAFSVLHELGHIDLHLTSDGEQKISLVTNDEYGESLEEREANQYAADALIDKRVWVTIPPASLPLNPYIIQKKYSHWADLQGLNKWIVLGRVSKETGMYKFKSDSTRSIN